MAYDNSNSGAIFRNEDKREGKKDPDYRGSAEVNGVAYFVDSWINTSKDGTKKFMSMRFKRKDKQPAASSGELVQPKVPPDFNQDIPF